MSNATTVKKVLARLGMYCNVQLASGALNVWFVNPEHFTGASERALRNILCKAFPSIPFVVYCVQL